MKYFDGEAAGENYIFVETEWISKSAEEISEETMMKLHKSNIKNTLNT